jgi:UPF0755 protein
MSTRRPAPRPSSQAHLRPKSPAEALEPTRAPSRPRSARKRTESRAFGFVVRLFSTVLWLVFGLMVFVGGSAALMGYQLEHEGPLQAPRAVVIRKGEGRIDVANRLEADGVISNRWTFVATNYAQAWFPGLFPARRSYEIKAGEYEIPAKASIRQVLDTLIEGRSVAVSFTAPEGLTSQQIVEKLKTEASLTGDIEQIPAEGSLHPDTYKIGKGGSRADVLDKMKADQQKLLAALWEARAPDLPLASMDQAVILASIVQRETGPKDEQAKVAAVFLNRLKRGMPLQSDPTILYGLYGGGVQWGKPILRSEKDSKTAHNTYQIKGLPPTPICNPGRQAIEAVLNPAKTNDLYFVADGQGGHTFTETLKDHNAAVALWRKHEREVRAAKGEPPPPDDTADADAPTDPAPAAPAAAPASKQPKKKR